MSRIRLRRPSAALVLSAAALFMALGGAAYAVPRASSTTVSRPSVVRHAFQIAAGITSSGFAACPSGSYATGGGVGQSGGSNSASPAYVEDSGPLNSTGSFAMTKTGAHPTWWFVTVQNSSTSVITEYVYAVCQHYG